MGDATWSVTSSGCWYYPVYGAAIDVFAANHLDHRIDVWTYDGVLAVSFGTFGTGLGQFRSPWDVEVTPSGRIHVVDKENDRVQVFGAAVTAAQPSTWGRLKSDYR